MTNKPPHKRFSEACAQLTASGSPFEIREKEFRGRTYKYYPNAPQHFRELFEPGRAHGDKTFLVYEGERWSFNDFFRYSDRLAAGLQKHQLLAPGQRAAIAMRNYPEWMSAFVAIASLGAIPVPINSWGSREEIHYILQDSGARLLFCDQARCDLLTDYIDPEKLPAIVARSENTLPEGASRWEEWQQIGEGYTPDLPDPTPDSSALLMYTSGTTGNPKGVLSLQQQICQAIFNFECSGMAMAICNGDILAEVMKNGDDFSSLLAVPLFHISGCHAAFLLNLRSGRRTVMMYKWDVKRALRYIEEEKVGILGLTPSMLMQLLTDPDFAHTDTSSLFSIGGGGSAFPPSLADRIERQAPGRLPGCGYGSTESNSAAYSMNGHLFRERPKASGLKTPIMEVQIRDEESRPLPSGESGEIWVYGIAVAEAYWGLADASAQSFVNGWYRSGDIGYLDEDGYLYIVDRIKDIIIWSGENISAQEVENVLMRHPEISDAAVIGLPHPTFGEIVAAVIVHAPGRQPAPEEVREYVRGRLAHFKVPQYLHLQTKPLPRNATGKLLKRELKKLKVWDELKNE